MFFDQTNTLYMVILEAESSTIVSIWWSPNDASRHHPEFAGWCLKASSWIKGLNSIIVSWQGHTTTYAKNGMQVNVFNSHLPGGGRHKHKWNQGQLYTNQLYLDQSRSVIHQPVISQPIKISYEPSSYISTNQDQLYTKQLYLDQSRSVIHQAVISRPIKVSYTPNSYISTNQGHLYTKQLYLDQSRSVIHQAVICRPITIK